MEKSGRRGPSGVSIALVLLADVCVLALVLYGLYDWLLGGRSAPAWALLGGPVALAMMLWVGLIAVGASLSEQPLRAALILVAWALGGLLVGALLILLVTAQF